MPPLMLTVAARRLTTMLDAEAVVAARVASLVAASRKVEPLSVMALAPIATLPLEASPDCSVYSKVKEVAVVPLAAAWIVA